MKLTVLMENESSAPQFCCAFGLSLYLELGDHRILFDAGPNGGFAENAAALDIDISGITEAVLSHSHYDHGDGLHEFFLRNSTAPVYARAPVFAPCFTLREGKPQYIGVNMLVQLQADRFVTVEEDREIAEGLWLFRSTGNFPTIPAGLGLKTSGGMISDPFAHEQSLLITEGDRAVVLAGCSHRGIVNILRTAEEKLGRTPDAVVGGFHLMRAVPNDPVSDRTLDRIADELCRGNTLYYTGHCTGDYAFDYLSRRLGSRLIRVRAGFRTEL